MKNKWIDVKERLPETDCVVLVVHENFYSQPLIACFDKKTNNFTFGCRDVHLPSRLPLVITHWFQFTVPFSIIEKNVRKKWKRILRKKSGKK